MPAPSYLLRPSDSIYAAWVARLKIDAEARQGLVEDEDRMRQAIGGVALERQPLVSIIMPSWNRAFTIDEAIRSVLQQSYGTWELIVCDDASEDRTSEIVRRFRDPRIRYMRFLKSNGAGARNKGLRHARGDYIAYLDSDNIWHPQFLDLMIRTLMTRPGSMLAYSAYLDTQIEGGEVFLEAISRPAFRPIRLSSKNFMDLNTIVHHRRVYDWLGGFDNALPRLQDWDLALRYSSIFRPIMVDMIGVFYRRNAAWGQLTSIQAGSNAQDIVSEKTRRRLEQAHERLKLPWNGRRRISILCPLAADPGRAAADAAIARSLARLAADATDVDLIWLGLAESPEPSPGAEHITEHAIPTALLQRPSRLGVALSGLVAGRPVLGVGDCRDLLGAIPSIDPRLSYQLTSGSAGPALRCLADPLLEFHLGALPLEFTPAQEAAGDPLFVVLVSSTMSRAAHAKLCEGLAREAERFGVRLLMPPSQHSGWQSFAAGRVEALVPDGLGALPGELAQTRAVMCLAHVAALTPFSRSLISALQAQGIPAALRAEPDRPDDFGQQWLDARAGYEIQKNDPRWILEKLGKLINDSAKMQQIAERSQTVQRIADHPDLARERLAHLLWRLLNDTPRREVTDATF